MMKELFDSPGCTRAVNTIALRLAISSSGDSKFVISNRSRSFPARDLQREERFIIPFGVYFISRFKKL